VRDTGGAMPAKSRQRRCSNLSAYLGDVGSISFACWNFRRPAMTDRGAKLVRLG